jgi:hypothetical protein
MESKELRDILFNSDSNWELDEHGTIFYSNGIDEYNPTTNIAFMEKHNDSSWPFNSRLIVLAPKLAEEVLMLREALEKLPESSDGYYYMKEVLERAKGLYS